MNEYLINIISALFSIVALPLLSILGTKLIKLINQKVNNSQYAFYLSNATNIVVNAIKTVFQTYVDDLKKDGNFTKENQLIALEKARNIALEQMSEDMKIFIDENYGDLNAWLNNMIESNINIIKKEKVL